MQTGIKGHAADHECHVFAGRPRDCLVVHFASEERGNSTERLHDAALVCMSSAISVAATGSRCAVRHPFDSSLTLERSA